MRELNSIEPVAGSAWTGAWELDGTHTATDEEGWAYAIDFWDLNRRQDRNNSKVLTYALSYVNLCSSMLIYAYLRLSTLIYAYTHAYLCVFSTNVRTNVWYKQFNGSVTVDGYDSQIPLESRQARAHV